VRGGESVKSVKGMKGGEGCKCEWVKVGGLLRMHRKERGNSERQGKMLRRHSKEGKTSG
jgi:hypothetical protein